MRRNASRILLFSAMFLVLPVSLLSQAEPIDAEGAVRGALAHANEGFTSTDVKELGWLGDGSAVALTKIISGRALEERDIEGMLLVVTLSYSAPDIVKIESDREPRTTLFLLNYLDLATNDAKLKEKIAGARTYVKDQYARSAGGGGRAPTPPR
jgi:hypothetical protein